jgi:hypothetical protein
MIAAAGYAKELGYDTAAKMLATAAREPKVLAVTPEILAAALRAYRAAKAQFMLSDDEASRMIAEAVLQAAS